MESVGTRTLRGILEYRAATTPESPFVVFDDLDAGVAQYSYGEFDARVNRSAHMLHSLGIGAGDKLNLHLSNCVEFLLLWFAAAKIGAVIMPTNVAATAEELEYLIDHSECRLIFTQSRYLDITREVQRRCARIEAIIVCDEDAETREASFAARVSSQPETPPQAPGGADDEVGILYTSGTTSRPKGVLVTNANYIYAGETVAKAICLAPDDRHLVVMPLFHGNAQYYSTMSTLVTGASMVLSSRFSASRFFDQAIRHGCTVSSLFSAPMRMLLAQPRREALAENRLRAVLFAQSVTEEQLEEWQERFGAPLLQLWGMTETMGPPLMNPIHFRRKNMSMGLPVMGYRVRLVDEQGNTVPRGEVGQIVVSGEPGRTLMKGYFKNRQATEETIRDGWLWSGDNAREDEEGYFYFVDRAKDMIKRSGENVAASEVEAVVLTHPKVFDCAVIGVPDPMRDEAIVAVVVTVEGEVVDEAAIVDWCRERLASFRVPERVEFRSQLPRTSVGKIQKHLLRAELEEAG
ncbi:MAG: AMP-binding protein [Gammaproteobacteria bacterium]|nr:AMP-binding protein [Gammaproteobacteria bacterium]NIM74921.1 AMP-binding protein [Gammaproteobacteria bacterium]NIN39710.1 AMP-binding protein [Gammaproteobacteria bacterium]NIO26838.1 AMP-binding protein [Gammaproteobacteria bacterium]NIO67394.1 AMP-binding protein [Gammaproteobacteria bacterium]